MAPQKQNRTQPFSARQSMFRHSYEVYRYKDSYLPEVALHHHDFYEIYLFLSGDVTYNIESRTYALQPGDVLLISPEELHQPIITANKQPYERMVLWISPQYLQQLCSDETDLTRCFNTRAAAHSNLLRPGTESRQLLTGIMKQLLAEANADALGHDIYATSYLLQLLVTLNRLWAAAPQPLQAAPAGVLPKVLAYINENYAEPLRLDTLAEQFYISKYHLCHEFQRQMGTSVYRYIIQKRLQMAKLLLSGGQSPTGVYAQCGFADYANFFRAFRAEYGITPKEFAAGAQAWAQT